ELADLIVPPSLREQHRRGLRRYLGGGEPAILDRRIEIHGMRRSGEEFPVELAVTRVDVAGSPLFTGPLVALTEWKRERERRAILVDAGSSLASSLDPDEIAAAVAALVVPRVADGCVVHVLDPGSRVARVAAVQHVSPELRARFEELLRLHVPTTDEPDANPVARALRRGRIELVSQVPEGWAAGLG